MAPRSRRKETAVPAHHLNYVVEASSSNSDWYTGPSVDMTSVDLSPEARARAQFDQRQRHRNCCPTETSVSLRYPEPWPFGLQDVGISGRELRTRKLDKIRQVRGNHAESFVCEVGRERRIDEAWFERTLNGVKRQILSEATMPWIKTAVFYPLGPKNILQARDRQSMLGRQILVLVNPNNALAYLVMQSFGNQQDDDAAVERFLRLRNFNHKSEMIAAPNAGYSMLYNYGETPKLVRTASDSTIALVFDSEYLEESRRDQSFTGEKFYQDRLGCSLRFTRRLSEPEKQWLEKQTELFNFQNRPLRILQFYSVEDRNMAVRQNQFEFLDVLFCESMFNYKEIMEQIHLYVAYSMEAKHGELVEVTLSAECDKVVAEEAFRAHSLICRYFNDRGVEEPELRYDRDHTKIILCGFPAHLSTFESQKWLVERIRKNNRFLIASIEPFIEILPDAEKKFREARNKRLDACIEQEIYRIGHCNKIYHPIPEEWSSGLHGGVGAQYMLKLVKERPDVPWKIFRNNRGPMQYVETYTVHFRTIPIGLRFIGHILDEASRTALFSTDDTDRKGPKIIPCYRMSITMSRAMRYALRRAIRTVDRDTRLTFPALAKNEDVMMENSEASYYGARLCEDWSNDSKAGVLEVQGWNPSSVRFFTRNLLKAIAPLELVSIPQCPPDENAQFFFGVGENYVRSLPRKYDGNVVIDIDQFSQKIRLWGLAAEDALEDLKSYSRNKSSIVIEATIPVHFPHFNDRVRNYLNRDVIEQLRRSLDLNKLTDHTEILSFEGTIEAYEKLIEGLTELSAAVFDRDIEGNQELEEMQKEYKCTCTVSEFARSTNFYRLHCGHVFCRTCLSQCINSSVNDSVLLIECPNGSCKKFISPTELMDIILGDDRRVRDIDAEKLRILVHKTKDAILAADPELKNCSTADCVGIYTKEEGDIRDLKNCTACRRRYCRQCLTGVHEGRTCEEAIRLQQPEESLKVWVREAGDRVKPCPVKECKSIIEKNDGCNHMQCPKCSIHFCWLCGFSADEQGPIYGHMNEVHGDFGLNNYVVDEDEEILQGPLMRLYMGVNMNEEESDDETVNGIDERNRQFLQNLGLHDDAPMGEIRRRAAVWQPNHRQRAPSPPRPPPPRRPRHFESLPQIVLDAHPHLTEADEEVYLGFLNSVATRAEQDERVRELTQL
ncbi:hypothetical protein L3Y34_019014 [Caenorhabditis briggsae]|uniref:RING-type domain-containing protein n=1 Tax=Caenorhabditis briggsae TaxID=6238 RepID=A0AAE9DPS9_CAEBR|nr:hypothetical protein L3Y34_019014 [Caenorhabditis briggsae]